MSATPAAHSRGHMLLGLGLAAAIIAGWLTIHIGGIFFWRWHAATLPLAVVLIACQAWLSTGLFIIAHDSMHGSLMPGYPRLNRAIGTLCLSLYAALSYATLLPKHHAHHRHAGSPDDPDFHPQAPDRLLPWFGSFFRGYYTHAQIARITVVAVAYIVGLGASLTNIIAFWAIPALIALTQLFVFGTYLPHRHGPEPFIDDHRARSSGLAPILSFLTCFHFGGYHHEHHLHPGKPWWRLPALRGGREATERVAG